MLDDMVDPEVGIAVAATAAVFSSRVRNWIHQGAVYGVAGALVAGDALTALGRGVARGMKDGISSDGHATSKSLDDSSSAGTTSTADAPSEMSHE